MSVLSSVTRSAGQMALQAVRESPSSALRGSSKSRELLILGTVAAAGLAVATVAAQSQQIAPDRVTVAQTLHQGAPIQSMGSHPKSDKDDKGTAVFIFGTIIAGLGVMLGATPIGAPLVAVGSSIAASGVVISATKNDEPKD